MCRRFLFSLVLCLKLFSHDVPLHPTHPRILSLIAWVNWGNSRGRHVENPPKNGPRAERFQEDIGDFVECTCMKRFPSNICTLFLMSLLVWKVLRSVDKSNEAVDFLCSVCAVLALLLAFAAFAQGLQELGVLGDGDG